MVKHASLTILLIAACAQTPPPGPRVSNPANAEPTAVEPEAAPEPPAGGCTAAEGGDSFGAMRNEVIGGLKLGLSETEVKAQVGEPASVSGPVDNSAVGSFGWTWSYPDRALALEMSAEQKTEPKTLSAITASKGSPLKTRFGIGVGSSIEDVKRAYGPCLDPDEGSGESIVAGSVYGGVIFMIEDGKVASFFVGAAAE
jgi:hypothetical protein